jgi:hypothetical protein
VSHENRAEPSEQRLSKLRETLLWRAISMLVNCVQLLTVGLLLEILLFTDTDVPVLVRLLVIAFLLAGMARAYGWLLLIANQLALFLSEPSSSSFDLGPKECCFCMVSLAIVALAYSRHNSGQIISDWITSRIAAFIRPLYAEHHSALTLSPAGSSRRAGRWKQVIGVFLQLLAFNAVVIASAMLLVCLPITPANSRQWLQLSLANQGMLWPGPMVVTCVIFLMVLLQYFSWRQLTTAQAGLWLRSGFMTHHFRDLAMIVRRRKKLREKATKPVK